MSRRVALWLVGALAVSAVLVVVGRWERSHRAADQSRGMRQVARAIGPLDSPSLDAFRVLGNFDCLLYRRGTNPFALELCVDRSGRVVEAIDRHGGKVRVWSLRDDPTRSAVRVDQAEVERLLDQMVVRPY
ncbi:MAG: hypothetical protein M3540_08535 [Actinomycetota bacterium]|nr:hypothetical protein [Actinomycetota bacterium]